jgi:hypothetical protein
MTIRLLRSLMNVIVSASMQDQSKPNLADLSKLIETSGAQLQRIKLGPGVVGRNASMVWMFEAAMIAAIVAGAYEHNTVIVGGAGLLAFCGLAYGLHLNNQFAKSNPVAAVTEGGDFVLCQLSQMGSKDKAIIDVTNVVPPPKSDDEKPR